MMADDELEHEVELQRGETTSEPEECSSDRIIENCMMALNVTAYVLSVFVFVYICVLCFSNAVVLFTFHPICMTLGYFLTAMSILVHNKSNLFTRKMTFMKRKKVHWIMLLVALCFYTLGFILIIVNKCVNDKPHFASLHGIFGLISYILMTLSFVYGYFTWVVRWLFKSWKKRTQLLVHICLGVLAFGVATLDYVLALFTAWFSKNASHCERFLCLVSVAIVALHALWPPLANMVQKWRGPNK